MLLEEFRDLVVTQLLAQLPDKAAGIQALSNDDDLLGSGLVDSYAFIDLCLAIEARTEQTSTSAPRAAQFGSIAALYGGDCVKPKSRLDRGRYDQGLLA
jgi:hypothetical protein